MSKLCEQQKNVEILKEKKTFIFLFYSVSMAKEHMELVVLSIYFENYRTLLL